MITEQKTPETLEKWSNLVKKAWRDESLKRRLIANPAAVLEEHGLKVRPGLEVRIVENSDKIAYMTLPARPEQGELTMDQLEGVAGGGTKTYMTYTLNTVFVSSY